LIEDLKDPAPRNGSARRFEAQRITLRRARAAGWRTGYISNEEGGAKLIEAIRQVLDGQIFESEKTSAWIVQIFSRQHSRESQDLPAGLLSERELEIFKLIGPETPQPSWLFSCRSS